MRPKEGDGRRRRLLAVAGILVLGCLVVAAVGVFETGRVPQPWLWAAAATPRPPTAAPSPAPSATPDPLLSQAQAIVAPAARPARLLVPAINVDAQVEAVGKDGKGQMGTPSNSANVAWYQLGAAPGDVGDAVIAGHLDWWDTRQAVFWSLGRLHKGDVITVVREDHSQVRFVTDSTSTVPFDASIDWLYANNVPPSLTLITCAGAWDRQRGTYTQRLLVHASLAS